MELQLVFAGLFREFPDGDVRGFSARERHCHYRNDVFPDMERFRMGADAFLDERGFDVRIFLRLGLCLERFVLRSERLVVRSVGHVFRRNRKLVVWRMVKLFRFLRRRNPNAHCGLCP